jgi:hypothetical protein
MLGLIVVKLMFGRYGFNPMNLEMHITNNQIGIGPHPVNFSF